MPSTQQNTLLLVDDKPDNLQILSKTLEKHGLDIMAVSNGEAALKVAAARHPDLILLEINIPGLNGFQVCQHLKDEVKTHDIPVIFLTILTDLDNKLHGFELGAVDYITKPVEPLELYARVTTHLNQQRLYNNLRQQLETYQRRFGQLDIQDSLPEMPQRHLQQINHARELLLKDLRKPPSLKTLAREVGSNPHKLSKDFQSVHGMTLFSWLRDYCLQEAANLLRQTNLTIEYIANAVGYTRSSNFATAFKRRFNLSPRKYRKSKTE